ncbi:Peptidyl-tRNA hydrolase, PTH2 [Dillenia turbinata]|uniref:peptidyl-tRNA hydrolase n=1 Tax=Dillenia turbinata TaxID=194707 RepID=A0AAN8V2P9_9MAGN
MLGLFRNPSNPSKKQQQQKQGGGFLSVGFNPQNFIPGLIIGFIFGWFLDFSNTPKSTPNAKKRNNCILGKHPSLSSASNSITDEELKMVLVVRQDLKMGAGKIASQCAHAAMGMYAELMQSQRSLLRQWEQYGQAKIVLTCKNQQEMNRLKEAAESIGLPTFVVADAGRTQVLAGSKTVLAIGPGRKASVDSVTGKLRLL